MKIVKKKKKKILFFFKGDSKILPGPHLGQKGDYFPRATISP